MNESPNRLVQEIWQSQPTEGIKMSADEIRKRAQKFERRILWRNVGEYMGALIGAAGFVYFFVRSHDTLGRVAFALLIAGAAYLAYQLHRRASSTQLQDAMGAVPWLEFYRGQLERQRDFLRGIRKWYLGPLIPGVVALSVASIIAHPHLRNLRGLIFSDVLIVFLIVLVWKLNQSGADCLQRQIDELHAAER